MGSEVKMMLGDETELRLGLPGGRGGAVAAAGGKRGFAETEVAEVDLKLNLSCEEDVKKKKTDINIDGNEIQSKLAKENADSVKLPPAKAQVVGWPPVRSYRKNILAVQKSSNNMEESEKMNGGRLIKVSMDGAPYLRKVDLTMYKSYRDLSDALGKMFSSFTIGNYGSHGMIDFMNESKLMDLINGSDYVPTYEDKDGDWMLVGDVPWEMFVESCKRLRIMKGKEAVGLAPRAMEKCKNRS